MKAQTPSNSAWDMSFKNFNRGALGITPSKFGLVLFVLLWVASGIGAFATPSANPGQTSPTLCTQPLPSSPAGTVFLTRDEALALAFPKCKVERTTAFLTDVEAKRVAKLAKLDFSDSVVYPYRATKEDKWVGTAYFDTHRVRSLRQTVMVVVKPDTSIGRVEVLSFAEPKDYLPREKWYAQFPGRKLDDDLNVNRKIRGVTGATLTSTATTACCRRVLALDAVLREAEAKRVRDEEAKRVREAEAKRVRDKEAKKKRTGSIPAGDS